MHSIFRSFASACSYHAARKLSPETHLSEQMKQEAAYFLVFDSISTEHTTYQSIKHTDSLTRLP